MYSGQHTEKQLEQFNSYLILLIALIANASLKFSAVIIVCSQGICQQ